ncbi:MAG: tetratricopeptide repeat protein [Pseudomonadota bacterium]
MTSRYLTLMVLGLLAGARAMAAEPTVVISAPQPIFEPTPPVVWSTEPPVTADEVAVSQELGALVRQQQYREALDRIENSEIPLSAAFQLLRAQLYSTLEENRNSIEAYEATLELAPDFTRAHAGLGTLYLVEGDFENAHEHLAEAVRLGAGDAQTYAQLGYLNLKRDNPWGAVSAYERAMMLEPESRQWQSGLLLALTESGHHRAAQSLLETMLTRWPDEPSLWQQRAELALRMDDKLAAFVSLEVSLRLGDESTENRQAAAQLAVELGNARRASELISAAVVAGDANVGFVGQLTNWLIRNGELGYAGRVLSAMAERLDGFDPAQQSRYYYLKGRVAEAQNDLGQALADYRRAVDLDGSHGNALLAAGEAALVRGEASRAMLTFERLEVLPDYRQQGLVGQAKALIALGDYAGALNKLQDTLQEFPEAYDLNAPIQSLVSIVNTTRNAAQQ